MNKNFLKIFIVISISLLNILNIKALEIDGEKYNIELINDYEEKVVYKDGLQIINKINKETSDLENGIINVDIIINNVIDNEIIYVIDNVDSFNNKIEQLNMLKDNIEEMEENEHVKQGIVTTTKDNKFDTVRLNRNIKDEIEKIKTLETGNNGDIFNAMEYASTLFTQNNTKILKTIVLIVNSIGSEEIEELKTKVNNIVSKEINLFVIKLNDNIDLDNYDEIFAMANSRYCYTSDGNCTLYNFGYNNLIFPCYKSIIGYTFTNEDEILNNFNFKLIDNEFASEYNKYAIVEEDRVFVNQLYSGLEKGENVKILNYSLSLKSNFDKNIIGKELVILKKQYGQFESFNDCQLRKNIISTYGGGNWNDFELDTNLSFKIVKEEMPIINEPIENPKTGIESYVVFGICLMIVSGVAYLIINKRKVL